MSWNTYRAAVHIHCACEVRYQDFRCSNGKGSHTLARMLWAFDILPVLGVDGKPDIQPSDDFTPGLLRRPANLNYRLSPRHHGVQELIVLECETAEMELTAWRS